MVSASSSENEEDLLIGRTIAGKFIIESQLGGGAMGDVYLAKHVALDTHVALKIMRDDLAKDNRFAERFQREAKAASKLNHPNSVRVIDYGQEPDGKIYIAMEYLEGRDLLRVINEDWPLPPDRVVAFISQALAALSVAHDLGIIHRDLKPENIMIVTGQDDEGNPIDVVKVCDFGIAKISDSRSFATEKGAPALTQTGSLIGTPEYMSREQARGDSLDTRSDLYSMGVVLYQLLAGDLPFKAENALGVVLKVVTDEPARPSSVRGGVHAGLEAVCMRSMLKGRGDRYQTAREMRTAVRGALGRTNTMEYPDSLSSPIAARSPFPSAPMQGEGQLALERAISSAPTIDLKGTHAPDTAVLISHVSPNASSSPPASAPFSSNAPVPVRYSPMAPKDTSAGTALAPQLVGPRSGFGVASAVIVAALAVIVGGGVVVVPKLLKKQAVTTATSASAGATDLEPMERETTFTSPLAGASGAGSGSAPANAGDPRHPNAKGVSANGNSFATGGANAGTNVRGNANASTNGNTVGKGPKTSASAAAGSAANPSNGAPLPSFTASPALTDSAAPAAFNPVNAHIEVGLITASGVDEGAVKGLMQTSKSRLNACYRDALAATGQRIDGTATISLSIDASAVVSGVAVTGIENLPQASRCFQTALFHRQLPVAAVQGGAATAEVWTPLKPE